MNRLAVPDDLQRFIDRVEFDDIGGNKPDIAMERQGNDLFHVILRFDLAGEVRQDDWQLRLYPSFVPRFHWAPHLTPTDEHIMDQHSFRSPALIVQDAERTITLLPDLDIMLRGTAVRWYLDLNAPLNTLTLGMSDYQVREHVLYTRKPGAVYPAGSVEVGLYLLVSDNGAEVENPWRKICAFLWERWGSKLFQEGEPLKGSLLPFVEHAYNWAFAGWKAVWQQIELEGKQVGAPAVVVNYTQSPNYPGPVNERGIRSIWNQAWFSSLRSASGLYRYAKRTGNPALLEKSLMMKELALSAPQKDGIFPAVIATEMEQIEVEGKRVNRSKGWDTRFWGNSNRNPYHTWGSIKAAPYHILDMSWTSLLMLRWYEELEADERLLSYAAAYADKLVTFQDADGFFPGWLSLDTLAPMEHLNRSPETSMSVTFLLALHKLTGDARYLDAARKGMEAVITQVVPEGRWEDFETHWSCSTHGNQEWVGTKVERNNMYKQCNFSMFWTAEALLACYEQSGDVRYLKVGERCLDELLMTQAVWQPPYLYVNTLGGFGVMNADGEWNDSRQSLFAELILRYGTLLERKEYVERGLAALRCSFVMMYCPENGRSKSQWEQAFPFFTEKDYGFMMENYGHTGIVDGQGGGMGEFTIFDWGNGAAAESYMRISERYGPLLDKHGLA